jgi:hypothetical protein
MAKVVTQCTTVSLGFVGICGSALVLQNALILALPGSGILLRIQADVGDS